MADEVYTDIDDLFERWAIMTAQFKWGDVAALRWCIAHCTPAIAQAFTQRIEGITANRNALLEYIEAGYWLVPCKEVNGEQKLYRNLYIDKATKQIDPAMQIKDKAALKAWQDRGIINFGLYPIRNRLIVIDLDRGDAHANKSDGIADFIELIKKLDLNATEQAYFADFPANFPCYVESAHGGIHLYFKDDETIRLLKPQIVQRAANTNIEVKYNAKVTVAGSERADGNRYILRGMLQNAPTMPIALLNELIKPQPKRITTPASTPARGQWRGKRNNEAQDGVKWNKTPEGVFAKVREMNPGERGHNFAYFATLYFGKEEARQRRAGQSIYTLEGIRAYIHSTPECTGRNNDHDTDTCIDDVWNKEVGGIA